MVLETKPITVEEFAEFAQLPENADQQFELINGELIKVSPGRTTVSEFRDIIAFFVRLFCREHNLPCHTSGEAGTYSINGHVVAPDFAYKPTPMVDEYPDPEPPVWVVEVISPTDKPDDIRAKPLIYIEAGILYWEMYPKSHSIDVYAPGQPPRTFNLDDVLDGGEVLPDFKLPVREIFKGQGE